MAKIIPRTEDFAKWYTSVLIESEMIDYGFVKGTIILKPYACEIWNKIKINMDKILKKTNTLNCLFPTFIPFSEFVKEAKHVEGFAPELFKITEVGNKVIEDKLVLRPTSEISFCNYFASLAISYVDLPIKLNQWCNIFRVEKNTKPFLRTSEFYWQEQHCIFATEKEAIDFSYLMIKNYASFLEKFLCIPLIVGKKTDYEKFAGAVTTYTVETLMQDGQALQAGTSHYLGTNFSSKFNINFQNASNHKELVYQTSAGVSTRLIGALVMCHADDYGLVMPSKIAPWEIVLSIFPSLKKPTKDILTNIKFKKIKSILKGFNYFVDKTEKSFGFKINKYETQGIPIQIILGDKEIESNSILIFNRYNREKTIMSIDNLNSKYIREILKNYDKNLYKKAKNFLDNSIEITDNLEDFTKHINNKKMVLALWSGNESDERKLKELTGASSRCISLEQENLFNKYRNSNLCFFTKKPNPQWVFFARAY